MKNELGQLVKRYGLYAALAAAVIISAAAANGSKSDRSAVVIYDASAESISLADMNDSSEAVRTTEAPRETSAVTTTAKAPKKTSAKTAKTASEKRTEEAAEIYFPIDINLVTFEELIAIDGVGESTAEAILSYRDSVGVITYMEQLLEISGIGEGKLELLCGYLYVDDGDYSPPTATIEPETVPPQETEAVTASPATTTAATTTVPPVRTETIGETVTEPPEPERRSVDINTADEEEIAECLLIDPELAEGIVEMRETIGGYSSYLELLYVKGMSKELLAELKEFILV